VLLEGVDKDSQIGSASAELVAHFVDGVANVLQPKLIGLVQLADIPNLIVAEPKTFKRIDYFTLFVG
jgi:hypothetical protein